MMFSRVGAIGQRAEFQDRRLAKVATLTRFFDDFSHVSSRLVNAAEFIRAGLIEIFHILCSRGLLISRSSFSASIQFALWSGIELDWILWDSLGRVAGMAPVFCYLTVGFCFLVSYSFSIVVITFYTTFLGFFSTKFDWLNIESDFC